MKTRTFEVSTDSMAEFARIIEENNLRNSIQGTTEDDDIIVAVQYEAEERQAVFELMDLLEPEDDEND